MTRPRAADDFLVIRARMEEIKREQTKVASENDADPVAGPRPYAIAAKARSGGRPGISPIMQRALGKRRSA